MADGVTEPTGASPSVGSAGRRVHRSPDARIVRSALDEIKAIQTLLDDGYKDAGDGRTLVRELVQNADDARAKQLAFAVLDQGWPEARNGLLRGPALLVVNDGPFTARDQEGLHRALGGSKADDVGKVGRFGIGLKSVFHLCEAIPYLGAEGGDLRPGVLNPWAGTDERGDADPIHPDWDSVDEDLDRLLGAAEELLGRFDDGLVLWTPLRRPLHLDRSRDRQYGLGRECPAPSDVARWFDGTVSLALLLAQCGHLQEIKACRALAPATLRARSALARVGRANFGSSAWVGRHHDDARTHERPFVGKIEDGSSGWSVSGVEALGCDSLRRLRSEPNWPSDPHWIGGKSDWIPRKALSHAAITILRPAVAPSPEARVRLRWAVFLPLDDHPEPRAGAVVDTAGTAAGEPWDIVLHGYFWPSHDRRSIPGVAELDASGSDDDVRVRWNRAIRDELLLPILPNALASAVDGIPTDAARGLLGAIGECDLVRTHLSSITRSKLLLPVLTEHGVIWEARDRADTRVLSVPRWDQAPGDVRARFLAGGEADHESLAFIDQHSPRLWEGVPQEWPVVWIERILNSVQVASLRSPEDLHWVNGLVHHILEPAAGRSDERDGAVARWLAARIGEGALAPTTEGAADDARRDELRRAWRSLFAQMPVDWRVEAPVEAQRAVVELAVAGLVGAGLCPVPLGRVGGELRVGRPDGDRLDRALLELGKRLEDGEGSSQRARRSRLVLAEALLAARGDVPLGNQLSRLPLLRALRLPDGRDEAWSVATLRQQAESHRVFARPSANDRSEGTSLESPSDPNRAVGELGLALGQDYWLVDEAVGSTTHAPQPTPPALASAVLHADAVQSAPAARADLVLRLAADGNDMTVRRAMRKLLTGQSENTTRDKDLLYVRSQDSDQDAHRRTLEVLLRLLGRPWAAIETWLVEPLPHALVEGLQVRAVDAGRLHRLLDECLSGPVDWTRVEHAEALLLLRRLYRTGSEDKSRWRKMPLHRGIRGDRGVLNYRARRSTGTLRPPIELEAEIRILDPDPEVVDLYQDVPALDEIGVLSAMLTSSLPQRFADQILRALRPGNEEQVSLPRSPELLDALRTVAWLPVRDRDQGVAPQALLTGPPELLRGLEPLEVAGALGDYRLSKNVPHPVWKMAEAVVHDLLRRPSESRQVHRVAQAVKPDLVARVHDGAYLILPAADRVSASLVEDALQTPIADASPGWMLLRTARDVAMSARRGRVDDASAVALDAVLTLARSLCGPVPSSRQIKLLRAISDTCSPSIAEPAGRLFRQLLEAFSTTPDFFQSVLPHVDLPTQDGRWRPAREVARSAFGVARRHRLVSDLRSSLRLDSAIPVHGESTVGSKGASRGASTLATYFAPWADRLKNSAVGAFLAVLGDGKDGSIADLAEGWLGDDVSLHGVRGMLRSTSEVDLWSTLEVTVSGHVARGSRVEALNVLGERVEMEAETDDETVFATAPECRQRVVGDFHFAGKVHLVKTWEISLRDVAPQQRTAHELIELLRASVETWAVQALQLEPQIVREWWSQWGSGSQAQVAPVQASIRAHLPLTLHELDVRESEPLRDALRVAQRAQRKREQAPDLRAAVDAERQALERLASLICDHQEHQSFVWGRVQELMRRFGYREDSVLLELAQNADDALAQAAEITGHGLPAAARRLLVRVHDHQGVLTVDVTHYGRPINDTGGAAFPVGQDRQWDQDLYFMMLLNLSAKPGEDPGNAMASATTGRFGLGFKAVHLVSSAPSIVSAFLAFSIAGGLLPREEPIPEDPGLLPIEGHRPTRIRLPLRADVDTDELLGRLFRRFTYARALLPVFARQISEVVVDGGPDAGVSAFSGEVIAGAPGWSVAARPTDIAGHGQYRFMRFRPADAVAGPGTAALVFGIRDTSPTPFPRDLPFLWNVAPTSEGWSCGYAVNGPFKLDPGRSHVALDDEATLRVVDELGAALGNGLVELHDALSSIPSDAACLLPTGHEAAAFFASLWTVLSSELDNRDGVRRAFLRRLHGPGRGVSVWMDARAVVPSGLPAPFSETLPPLGARGRIERAVDGLDDPHVCSTLAGIEDVVAILSSRQVVSARVARHLQPLVQTPIQDLRPAGLLAELTERWGQVLSPARMQALRPLASEVLWNAVASGPREVPWSSKLVARSQGGTTAALRDLLLPRSMEVSHGDLDVVEELRRSAFAPDEATLDPAYVATDADRTVFQRLRVRHQIDAATMASWYAQVPVDRRPAALRYLLNGRLQQEVLQKLVPSQSRPSWLIEYDAVAQTLESLGEEGWRCRALLAALFPERFESRPEPVPQALLAQSARRRFFDQLQQWWDDPEVRGEVVAAYETRAWPEWLRGAGIQKGLREGSRDHWLCLLVLGACQSLGRAQESQHRTFLESARSEGWWEVFKTPDATGPWMDVLRTWQDRCVSHLEYSRWMSLFPAIYQLSRYLETYRRLLESAGRRPKELYRIRWLLAPRGDDSLTGAGQAFDAPPAPLGMGLHWILRELIRLEILSGDHILKGCWVPTEQLLRFLRPLGLEVGDGATDNADKAESVHAFMADALNTHRPHLHYAFDIPLRHIDADARLRRRLGLED